MQRILGIIIASLLGIGGAHAQSLPVAVANSASNARYHADIDFTADIDRARALLAKEVAGFTTKNVTRPVWRKKKLVGKKVIGKKLDEFYILLAVKKFDSKNIELVRIDEDGDNPVGYKVDWAKMNGVNTHFLIQKPAGYAVLAIKRVVRSGKSFAEVVYTPFSHELDTPTMRKRGMQYLQTALANAYKDIETLGVRSRALPDVAMKNLVPPDVSLVLSIIEHIDPARSRKEPIEKLVNEVLVVVAGNRELAYAYAVSKAKARGLFQFIPRTYASLLKQYPEANLVPHFVQGMNRHVNAAKASLLLFDADLRALPREKRQELMKDKAALAEYLAIAYNSGSRRAVRAYQDGSLRRTGLPLETVIYLEKLNKVRSALKI